MAKIYGTSGKDNPLRGTSGNDSIYGLAGDDLIITNDGDDYVEAGDGDDQVNAYPTANGGVSYYWSTGSLTIYGGNGNDFLSSGAGTDRIYGEQGNDTIYGQSGNDILDGGTGDDFLYGGYGDDTYYVDSASDFIYDTAGNDTTYVSTSFVKIPSNIEKVVYTDAAIALPYWIDALVFDSGSGNYFKKLLGESKTLYYCFAQTLPSYDTDKDDANGFQPFNLIQTARTIEALNYISTIIDVVFVETTNPDSLNTLTFANSATPPSGAAGYARPPGSYFLASDIYLNKDIPENLVIADGSYYSTVLIHEIGHALGLKHTSSNAGDPPYLSGTEDTSLWSQMSEWEKPGSYHLTYSPLDIAALQYIYGTSQTVRTGNDTYSLSSTEPNFIWDGKGTDAIDISDVTLGSTVYLTPGYQGFLGTTKAEKITTAGQITVNFGSVIENLIGSNYDDHLYGNDVGNKIEGGSGSDSIEGWDGNDTLLGGSGNDYLIGGSGNDSIEGGDGIDTLVVSGLSTNYTIRYDSTALTYSIEAKTGTEGKDTFKTVEFLKFSDKTLAIQSVDLTPPTIAVTSDLISLGYGNTATILFTLSEASTTFTASDVTVSGGTLANFTGSGSTYAATFTPAANSIANGVVSVASGVFTDLSGNVNSDGNDQNNTASLKVDTLPPTIALSASKTALFEGEFVTVTFSLNEASITFTDSDITVSGGAISKFMGSGLTYSANFTLSTNSLANGALKVASGVFTDFAGNSNADGADTNNSIFFSRLPKITNETHVLSVIVDRNVFGSSATLLKELKEFITYTNGALTKHLVEYSGLTFDYNQIDALITTVTRDGEFTSEFTKEINDYLNYELNIPYSTAVKLVGATSIDGVILSVAGADGNFVE